MSQEEFIASIARKFSGSISAKENEALLRHIREDQEAQKVYAELEAQWNTSGKLSLKYQPDLDASWSEFVDRVGTKKQRAVQLWPALSGVAALLALAVGLAYYLMLDTSGIRYETAANETKQVELPDGSVVDLEESTTLALSDDFNDLNREMTLVGGAFFDVKRDETKPFIIQSGQTTTEVLGTSFHLSGNTQDETVLQVITGKVSFSAKGEELILLPNMTASFSSSAGSFSFIEHPSLLQQGALAFDNTRLADVVALIESQFKVKIQIENIAAESCLLTAKFQKPKLEEVLRVIAITLELEIVKLKNSYLIKGAGCSK